MFAEDTIVAGLTVSLVGACTIHSLFLDSRYNTEDISRFEDKSGTGRVRHIRSGVIQINPDSGGGPSWYCVPK